MHTKQTNTIHDWFDCATKKQKWPFAHNDDTRLIDVLLPIENDYCMYCTQAEATDRASQAEAKYREALEDAQRQTKEHGVSSVQARAAWDVVDEIGVSFCGNILFGHNPICSNH